MTAGILGFVGIREWDRIAMFLNKVFNLNMQTGTEWVLRNVKSDTARFGALSAAGGWHYGSVFGAPSVTGAFAPGVQQWFDFFNAIYVFGKEAVGGRSTEVDKREALKGVMPRITWGHIEKAYTPEGMPYQSSRSEGAVRRTDEDWQARKWGTYTTDEVKRKTADWEIQRKSRETTVNRSNLLTKMGDALITEGQIPQELVDRARELDYDPQTLYQGLYQEILNRYKIGREREIGKGTSPRQQRLLLLLQQLESGNRQ
jgi:hypothetical protein